MTSLKKIRQPTHEIEGLWVVERGGKEIGFLTKYEDTRTDTHPWKAFAGIGKMARFLGCWYDSEGSWNAAMNAVLKEVK